MIDRVRDWGNIFTGNTGLAIANALSATGPVDLLTSNRSHLDQIRADSASHILADSFTTHAELRKKLDRLMSTNTYDAIFMTAAVADYRPAGVYAISARNVSPDGSETWTVRSDPAGKVKSTHPLIAVLGQPTEKLVDLFRSQWNHRGLLVKFKLEVGLDEQELMRVAEHSRLASGADYIVANTLDMVAGPRAGAWLLSASASQWIPRGQLPDRLSEIVQSGNSEH